MTANADAARFWERAGFEPFLVTETEGKFDESKGKVKEAVGDVTNNPDLEREDIQLRVENNTLTITGHKKMDNEVKEHQYHRIERTFGQFSRSFTLPPTVDTNAIGAEYKNGVLTVRLPLRDEAKPKQIQVQVH